MLDSILHELFKGALDTKLSSDQIKERIADLEDLFSGEAYQHFLDNNLSDSFERHIIIKNIGTCLVVPTEIPDEVLAEMPEDLKKRVSEYLDNIQGKITKVITEAQLRLSKSTRTAKSPKKLEEMTREELLDYIESKWKRE